MIGDAAHQSRESDHNGWVIDSKGIHVVTGIDIDRDLSATEKVDIIVDALVANKDPRIKYMIRNSRIISSYPAHGYAAWQWRPYSGKNSHKEHLHISVKAEQVWFDNENDWDLAIHAGTKPQPVPVPFSENTYTVQSGDNLTRIADSFGIKLADLVKLNNIKDPNKIASGQKLRIR